MDLRPTVWLPLVILGAGGLGAAALLTFRPEVETSPPERPAPLVHVREVAPGTVRLGVSTHGTVEPRTESVLLPEVSGRIEWVSPSFVSGGFFEAGDPLVRIDRRDYEVALELASASLARAQSEHHRARKELGRLESLAERNIASPSQLDDAVTAERVGRAALREARARLDRAQRDLERTELTAPYRGRVRTASADVGQVVGPGTSLATLYAIDWAEIRLPVPVDELAFLDLPAFSREGGEGHEAEGATAPPVELRARFAGREYTWTGRVVRTEGEIDPRSRMVHVVARVEDPYGRAAGSTRPPLAVGLFVEAEIHGPEVDGITVVPRGAMRGRDQLIAVDREDRLRLRTVDVLRERRDEVLLRSRLEPGDRVAVSTLEAVVDGMAVRPIPEKTEESVPPALAEAPR